MLKENRKRSRPANYIQTLTLWEKDEQRKKSEVTA